jgi:hypothetical protein
MKRICGSSSATTTSFPSPAPGANAIQVLDASDVLSLLRQCGVDLVLSGHRHVPYVWPIAGMLLVHSGTVSTLRTRGFPHPAYNLITIDEGRISVGLLLALGGNRHDEAALLGMAERRLATARRLPTVRLACIKAEALDRGERPTAPLSPGGFAAPYSSSRTRRWRSLLAWLEDFSEIGRSGGIALARSALAPLFLVCPVPVLDGFVSLVVAGGLR